MINFRNFSFGITSAVLTSIAIIIGLSSTINAKVSIIIALLIVAIADNISDSFGIHIHEECKCDKQSHVMRTTLENFFSRLFISLIFVVIVLLVPMDLAVIISIILSLFIIIILSYYISKNQKIDPVKAITRHLIIAIIVILTGFILKYIITNFSLRFLK